VNVFVEKSLLILGQHSIQPIRFEEQVYMSSLGLKPDYMLLCLFSSRYRGCKKWTCHILRNV